jgi:hypothetical protein
MRIDGAHTEYASALVSCTPGMLVMDLPHLRLIDTPQFNLACAMPFVARESLSFLGLQTGLH